VGVFFLARALSAPERFRGQGRRQVRREVWAVEASRCIPALGPTARPCRHERQGGWARRARRGAWQGDRKRFRARGGARSTRRRGCGSLRRRAAKSSQRPRMRRESAKAGAQKDAGRRRNQPRRNLPASRIAGAGKSSCGRDEARYCTRRGRHHESEQPGSWAQQAEPKRGVDEVPR